MSHTIEHLLLWLVIILLGLGAVIHKCSDAHASILTASCESGCLVGHPNVVGPGVLAVAWQTADDAYAVPGVYIRPIAAGEYAKIGVEADWLRQWLALFRRETACVKWRWVGKPPPGASTEWSDPGRWCFGVDP